MMASIGVAVAGPAPGAAGPWARLRTRAAAAGAAVRETGQVLAGTPRALRMVWEAHPGYATALLALNLLQGLLPLAQLWVVKLLVDAAVAAAGGGVPAVAAATAGLAVLAGVVALAGNALDPAAALVQQQLGDHLTREVNRRVLRKANSRTSLAGSLLVSTLAK